MSANLFAAIRPSPGTDRRDPSPGNRRGAMVGAHHVGEFIRRYSPGDRRDPSPARGSSPPIAGTDRRDPSPGNRRGAMVGANHVGEFIRRYSLLFAHMFAAYRKQKKPHPWLWVRVVREG